MTKIDVKQELGENIIWMYKNIIDMFPKHENYVKLYNELITLINIEEVMNYNFKSIQNNIIINCFIHSTYKGVLTKLICDECNEYSNTFLYILGKEIINHYDRKIDTVHICENCINKLYKNIHHICQLNLINSRFKCTNIISMFSEKYDKFLCTDCFKLSLEYEIEHCTERTFDHNSIIRIQGVKDI